MNASNTVKKENEKIKSNKSLWARSRDLFQRVPILHALACEILACQALSTILNVSFITKLKDSLPHGADRASWTGRVRILSFVPPFHLFEVTITS